eukprot:7554813-Pyramimonas_sp.AAC.1
MTSARRMRSSSASVTLLPPLRARGAPRVLPARCRKRWQSEVVCIVDATSGVKSELLGCDLNGRAG